MTSHSQKVHTALKWITDLLNRLNIPFQAAGGLAARCYGASRPLHDIDLYVPHDSITELEQELQEYLIFGPEHYRDDHWDLVFIKIRYKGQQIEIGDAGHTRYYDSQSQKWVKEEIDFAQSTIVEYDGIELPVMPKQQLIEYKQRLGRKVDRLDVQELLS